MFMSARDVIGLVLRNIGLQRGRSRGAVHELVMMTFGTTLMAGALFTLVDHGVSHPADIPADRLGRIELPGVGQSLR